MNTMKAMAALVLGFSLTAGVALAAVEDEIRARIAPIGDVCVEGEDCGDIATADAPAAASDEPRTGDEVYASACQACHSTGAAGAPKIGEQSAWADRVEKGRDTLVTHAIEGFNAMPAMGGCGSCSEEEIEKAVEHMLSQLE